MDRRRFLNAAGLMSAVLAARGPLAEAAERLGRQVSEDWTGLRDAYPLDPAVTYLNHASIGTIPKPLLQTHCRYLELCESNPWLHMWGGAWEEPREETRARAAELLGCDAGEVAITHNTTEGFNLLAQGLPLGPGDEVLFSSLNHTGASVAWNHQAPRRGFEVRRFDFPVTEAAEMSPGDLVARYAAEISDRTRVLVFPHIDNIVGFRYPLQEMASMARARGVRYVAVDGAQSAGMIPLELSSSGVDFYATSGHKWLQGPKGTGLLYARRETQEAVLPMRVTWGQAAWSDSVRMFEDYGTRNLAETLVLGDAIRFQEELGYHARYERLRHLWTHAKGRVEESARLAWRSPLSFEAGASLFAVEIEGVASREASRILYSEHGIIFRPFTTQGLNTIRLSPNVFNTEAEIDRFVELAEAL